MQTAQVEGLAAAGERKETIKAPAQSSMSNKDRRHLTWAQVCHHGGGVHPPHPLLSFFLISLTPLPLQITKSLLAGGVAGAV